jgi:hypothetical protein
LGHPVDGITCIILGELKGQSRDLSISGYFTLSNGRTVVFCLPFFFLVLKLIAESLVFLASTPPHDDSMRAWFVEQPFLIPREISSAASVASTHKKPEGHYKVSCRTAVGKMANKFAEINGACARSLRT